MQLRQPQPPCRGTSAQTQYLNEPMQYFIQAIENSWAAFQYICLIYCVGIGLEVLWPAEKNQPIERLGFNIAYTAIFVLLTNLLVPPLQAVAKPWIDKYGLALPVALPDSFIGQLGQVLIFFFIVDFFYYWFHRSQHRFNWLWGQHKLHHSEYSLNITAGNRHHWIEEPLRVFAVWLPIGLLFQQKPVTIGWLWSGFLLWGYFIHLNVRLPFGKLTPVFCGPQLHRVHHSTAPQHIDKNFAAFFPVLDVVFGTYCKPERREYPTTGLADGENLNSMVKANLAPFIHLWDHFKRPAEVAAQTAKIEN
jgi:sterol desaturase/sphingolipid hydroxylase (fatty acid hydroxylase superfamily)